MNETLIVIGQFKFLDHEWLIRIRVESISSSFQFMQESLGFGHLTFNLYLIYLLSAHIVFNEFFNILNFDLHDFSIIQIALKRLCLKELIKVQNLINMLNTILNN